MPSIRGLWTDAAGDIFAWACGGQNCTWGQGLYRLDASTGRWGLAVSNTEATFPYRVLYTGFAVTPAGDVIAVDSAHFVIRQITAGADPASSGTVVAGTLGTAGVSGDGGPATSATIAPSGPVAVSSSGDIFFADGGYPVNVRRVDPDGAISSVSDPTASSAGSGVQPSVVALAVSQDAATLYVLRYTPSGQEVVRADPVGGPDPYTVAGPSAVCDSGSQDCLGSSLTEAPDSGVASVLVAGWGSITGFPADGSDPLADHRYAGLPNDAKGLRSPDGTPLDEAFLGPINDIAVAPSGEIAMATLDGIRTLTGLSPDSALGTLVSDVSATSLRYGDDATLYALVAKPTPHVLAVAPDGVAVTILGGGEAAVGGGVAGTDVALSGSPNIAVDPSNGAVYFDDGTSVVWELDAASGTVHAFGDVATYTTHALQLAVTPNHGVLVDASDGLIQIDPDATPSRLDCSSGCPTQHLEVLDDGTLVGSSGGLVIRGLDGATLSLGTPVSAFAITPDHQIVIPADAGWAGGLLAVSAPITAPPSIDVPVVQVSAVVGGVQVRVTPAAVHEHISISGGLVAADGRWLSPGELPASGDETDTDGSSTTYQRTLTHLFTTWPNHPSPTPAGEFGVEVVASETDSTTGVTIDDAPQIFDVQPAADTTAPPNPGFTLVDAGLFVNLTLTHPVAPDLDRVVVCESAGSTPAPTGPWGCDDVGESRYFDPSPQTLTVSINPFAAARFTAFSVDSNGNASSGVSVVRPAAVLAPGAAVTRVGYDSQPGVEEVMWQSDFALHVRYAAGAIAPATMSSGTEAAQYESGFGYGAKVPAAPGAKVAVSIFTYGNSQLTTYKRTSFVVTGGTNSDVVGLSATTAVNPGTRPAIVASWVRHSPTEATIAIANQQVYLYQRPVGASQWTFVGSAYTSASGSAALAAPVPSISTDYRALYYPLNSAPRLSSSPVVRTSVWQIVSASLPSRVAHGHPIVVTGGVGPHRTTVVYLQRDVAGRWVNVASARSAASGAYRIGYTPTAAGVERLRVLVASTATMLAGTTSVRTLTVT